MSKLNPFAIVEKKRAQLVEKQQKKKRQEMLDARRGLSGKQKIATVDASASGGKSRPRKPVTRAPPAKEGKKEGKKGKKEKA